MELNLKIEKYNICDICEVSKNLNLLKQTIKQ